MNESGNGSLIVGSADYQDERRADKTDGKAYARAHHKADGKVSAELMAHSSVEKVMPSVTKS